MGTSLFELSRELLAREIKRSGAEERREIEGLGLSGARALVEGLSLEGDQAPSLSVLCECRLSSSEHWAVSSSAQIRAIRLRPEDGKQKGNMYPRFGFPGVWKLMEFL
jgi:hypothetical protein